MVVTRILVGVNNQYKSKAQSGEPIAKHPDAASPKNEGCVFHLNFGANIEKVGRCWPTPPGYRELWE